MGVLKTTMSSLTGLVLGAGVAMAEEQAPTISITDGSNAPLLQLGPEGDVDVYVLEQNFYRATGESVQRRGFYDHEAGMACEYEVRGTHNVGIVGLNTQITELHGIEMPQGSRFADTYNVESSLECEKTNTVPEEWLGSESDSNPVAELTDEFADSVSHVLNSGNAAVLFIQADANDTARTVYSRENIGGTGEYTVSVAEMISPASNKLDFMFVDGELVDTETEGFVPLADAEHFSFE